MTTPTTSDAYTAAQAAQDASAKHDTRAVLQAAGEATAFDSSEWLGKLTGPSAVILTNSDQVVSPAVQRELCHVLGNPMVQEVEGDHFVCVKRPEVFNEALIAACAGCCHSGKTLVGRQS